MKISKDQNKITLDDGVKLVASEGGKKGYCYGCYFNNDCGLCIVVFNDKVRCMPNCRNDKRNVIFIQKAS